MPGECLIIQHVASEPPGTIETVLQARGVPVRKVEVFSGHEIPPSAADLHSLVIMGGPMGLGDLDRLPHLREELRLMESALKHEIPVWGVCLGSQLLAAALGAAVTPGKGKEIGWYEVSLTKQAADDPLFQQLPDRFQALHWHGDVYDVPLGATPLARSEKTPVQAFRYGPNTYGTLFHFEVTPSILQGMVQTFAGELVEEHLSGEEILQAAGLHLPRLMPLAKQIFSDWID